MLTLQPCFNSLVFLQLAARNTSVRSSTEHSWALCHALTRDSNRRSINWQFFLIRLQRRKPTMEGMTGTPWLGGPMHLHAWRMYECSFNETSKCEYQKGYWRFW